MTAELQAVADTYLCLGNWTTGIAVRLFSTRFPRRPFKHSVASLFF